MLNQGRRTQTSLVDLTEGSLSRNKLLLNQHIPLRARNESGPTLCPMTPQSTIESPAQKSGHALLDWILGISYFTICGIAGVLIHAPYLFSRGATTLPSVDTSSEGLLTVSTFFLASLSITSAALIVARSIKPVMVKGSLALSFAVMLVCLLPWPSTPQHLLHLKAAWLVWVIASVALGLFLWLAFDSLRSAKPSTRDELALILPAYTGLVVITLILSSSYSLWILPRVPRFLGGVNPVPVVFSSMKTDLPIPRVTKQISEPVYLVYDDGTHVWLDLLNESGDSLNLKRFLKSDTGNYAVEKDTDIIVASRKKRWAMVIGKW
jgi:hypothetical protein